jgi:hypothetical protein
LGGQLRAAQIEIANAEISPNGNCKVLLQGRKERMLEIVENAWHGLGDAKAIPSWILLARITAPNSQRRRFAWETTRSMALNSHLGPQLQARIGKRIVDPTSYFLLGAFVDFAAQDLSSDKARAILLL